MLAHLITAQLVLRGIPIMPPYNHTAAYLPTYLLVKSLSKRPSGEVHLTGNFSPLDRRPSEGFMDRPKSATLIMIEIATIMILMTTNIILADTDEDWWCFKKHCQNCKCCLSHSSYYILQCYGRGSELIFQGN